MYRLLALVLLAALVGASQARPAGELRAETEDWTFSAPGELGTQADLDLLARSIQICSDEIERLVGYRPRNVVKFTAKWVIDGARVSYAGPTGIENHAPDASYRLVDAATRPFLEANVSRSLCFGPHEVTHVLTWESWAIAWANEGFATFTDRLYRGEWRCCTAPGAFFDCDATGYLDGATRVPYADLRAFRIDTRDYHTAACFWLEVYRRGGFRALRKMLAASRVKRPSTPAALAAYANSVLGGDIRPVMTRYGFTAADLDTTGIVVPPALDPIGCVVPRVIGLSLRAARAKLVRAGCSTGRVVRVFSPKRAGLVLTQRPAPRMVRPERTPVSLRVSRGPR